MKKLIVALRYEPSVALLFGTAGVEYRTDGVAAPDGTQLPVCLLLVACSSVSATDHGLVRLEIRPREGDRALPFSAVSVPAALLAWSIDSGNERDFPVGFLRTQV